MRNAEQVFRGNKAAGTINVYDIRHSLRGRG